MNKSLSIFSVVLWILPREILLVPPRRQVGGRGADGTRRISLGGFFLCRSEAEGEGQSFMLLCRPLGI